MKLISLCCSGESLEKAIVLFETTYKNNKAYYDGFEKVILFYSDNLPKKNRNLIGMSGTISFLQKIYTKNFSVPLKIYDKKELLSFLITNRIITDRVGEKLLYEDERLEKIIRNLPIEFLYKNYYQQVMYKFNDLFPNVEFIKLSIKDNLGNFIKCNYGYDGHSKIYGLQSDGNIGIYNLGSWGKIKQFNMVERINRSICLSPNIYVYILMIDMWASSKKDIVIGYRPMRRYIRQAYDLSIKRLKNSTCIEPPNVEFSNVLDSVSCRLSVEERSNLGIIKCFADFLNK